MTLASLASSATAVVWLTVGLVTTVAIIAMLVALVRHVLLIGRAAGRLNDEVAPIMQEIQAKAPAAPRREDGGR